MYRVALCAIAAIALAACSLGSANTTISSGYAQPDTTGSITSSPDMQSVALGGDPGAPRGRKTAVAGQQYASLGDQAPKGSYEKATTGALSDRDYSHTALDPEKARDVINQYRRDKGLKPLRLNSELSEAAKGHSRDLAKWDRISHYGSDGSNPWDRVKRTGFNAKLAAENVGTGQVDFLEVMRGWKDSPGHNKNLLLKDATHMGIALVQDPRTEFKSFWTLVIGTPM